MGRRIIHLALLAAALMAVCIGPQVLLGRFTLAYTAVVLLCWFLIGTIAMPRLAHAAFRAGATAKARRRYHMLAVLSPGARDAARVSIAACHLIDRQWGLAQEALLAIDGRKLSPQLRAAWLNNRAYAIARGGLGDPGEPLALSDEALALRPGVPGFLHTRGLVLLAAGRTDEAIRAFEAVWESGDVEAALEAERCHDLAAAWDRKGQTDYAADYRLRAVRASPASPWASEAGAADHLAALESQIAS